MDYVIQLDPERNASVSGGESLRQAPNPFSDTMATAEITPQIVAVIQEAVAAYFGRKVRILSVKVGSEPMPAAKTSWTGQGRDIIQGSHNLVQRGR